MNASVSKRYLNGPFGQVHLRVCGEPGDPPLMLLHMSPKSSRGFAEVMPHLAAAARYVVASDYPGYGESDPVPDGEMVTVGHYARSCWAVADALSAERGRSNALDLMGHHTGSKVAVEMAYQRPGDVRRLVLVSTAILTPEEQADLTASYQPVPLDAAGTRFRRMWELVVQHRGPGMTLQMMAEAFAENLRGGERYEDGHHAAFAYNAVFAERAGALPHPVTVLNPKDDLWAITPRAKDAFRDVRVEDHPEWGHGFFSAYPEDAAAAVLRGL